MWSTLCQQVKMPRVMDYQRRPFSWAGCVGRVPFQIVMQRKAVCKLTPLAYTYNSLWSIPWKKKRIQLFHYPLASHLSRHVSLKGWTLVVCFQQSNGAVIYKGLTMQCRHRWGWMPRNNIDTQNTFSAFVRVYDSLLMLYCLNNIWTAVWCHQTMASNCINHSKQQDFITNYLFHNTRNTQLITVLFFSWSFVKRLQQ